MGILSDPDLAPYSVAFEKADPDVDVSTIRLLR
jgi:hypothetical protein